MPQIIDMDFSDAWVSGSVTLDGVDYLLELAWNTRDSRWYLSLAQADETVLASGVAVTVDTPLLGRFSGAGFPPGRLMAFDTSEAGREIVEMEDLGVRVQLMYLSEAEVEALDV